jgi:putative membrane protein
MEHSAPPCVDSHQHLPVGFVHLARQGRDEEDAMWWSDYWPMPWFGPFMMIFFLIVCMAMMFFMMRGGMHRRSGGYAIEILKERFARGEINQAEFEERRRFLEG